MMKTIVFDFDKTLTYKDSLTILFLNEMKGWKTIYIPYYYCLKILSKLGIIPVFREKEIMFNLLFNSDISMIDLACKQLKLRFTPIMDTLYQRIQSKDNVIILSATLENYLNVLFSTSQINIIGTTIRLNNGRITIENHPSGINKLEILKSMGVNNIDEMYYDSSSDECLIPISEKWYKVKNGIIIKRS